MNSAISPSTRKPILVFSWGNPSRGDDALGPLLHDMLLPIALPCVELITDFQLQIEHTLDLKQRNKVYFVDAAVNLSKAFEIRPIHPQQDNSFTTHSLSPACLLNLYLQMEHQPLPECLLLSISGYHFELGQSPGRQAMDNLDAAFQSLVSLLKADIKEFWA